MAIEYSVPVIEPGSSLYEVPSKLPSHVKMFGSVLLEMIQQKICTSYRL